MGQALRGGCHLPAIDLHRTPRRNRSYELAACWKSPFWAESEFCNGLLAPFEETWAGLLLREHVLETPWVGIGDFL